MKTSTSLFARALATENIFVNFDTAAPSASFDLDSRTLTIPDWKASDSLRDMIVAHEVAHALFTPPDVHTEAVNKAKENKLKIKGFCSCLNVIEDARIERMIKEKFPGCRRDFYEGYKEILDKDIFGINGVDVTQLSIIDKINLHFKVGILNLMTVPLSAQEQQIIDRVNRAKSYEDVVEIATDLYALAEDEAKQKKKKNPGLGDDEMEVRTSMDDAMQKFDREGKEDPGRGQENFIDFPYASYLLPKANSGEAIIPYKKILTEMDFVLEKIRKDHPDGTDTLNGDLYMISQSLEQFRKDTNGMVRELAMQFERRKAAEEIKKERMKNTGVINPDKLFQYKTHDDIFLRNLVKYEGKKHGMVMLIDWSGSMACCLDGVIRQVMIMTWFCRKIGVPYEVFLFTEDAPLGSEGYEKMKERHDRIFPKKNMPNGFDLSNVALRQVLSSQMNEEEQRRIENLLWTAAMMNDRESWGKINNSYLVRRTIPAIMDLHGTPTNEALLVLHDFLPKYKAITGIDIVNFMLITDGDPTGMTPNGKYYYRPVKGVRVQHAATGRTIMVPGDKEGYVASLNSSIQYFLVDEIRKLGATTVGFSIGGMGNLATDLVSKFIDRNSWDRIREARSSGKNSMEIAALENKVTAAYNAYYKRENFIPSNPDLTPGFDEYYIVRPVKPKTDIDEIPTGATLVRIRNNFLKALTGRKHSRVFLSRFIDLIAGRKLQKFKLT